jgi:hypothetical protein
VYWINPIRRWFGLPHIGEFDSIAPKAMLRLQTCHELALIDPQTMTSVATQDLIGINARAMVVDPLNPLHYRSWTIELAE